MRGFLLTKSDSLKQGMTLFKEKQKYIYIYILFLLVSFLSLLDMIWTSDVLLYYRGAPSLTKPNYGRPYTFYM